MNHFVIRNRMITAFVALATIRAIAGQTPSVHMIKPTDDPQSVMDSAAPGDRLVFLPGVHQHHTTKYDSILYVDKPVDVELQPGAVLKLADHETALATDPEITTDQGITKKLDDFEAGGLYDLRGGPRVYMIRIEREGSDGAPDAISWGSGSGDKVIFQHFNIPVTGDWQNLEYNVQIRFRSKTGHNAGSLWYISYDGRASYGIRIGHGTQRDYIDGVRIFGQGVIDMNRDNNVEPSYLVKDINAAVLIHGRVRNVTIEGITMTNTNRSVMAYGEHTGKFLQGGASEPGEYFDAENISILRTSTINPKGSGILLGHPSHRGHLTNVRCNHNYLQTATTAIEPNFQLKQYEVIGNVIESGGRAIHCWRRSTNGLVAENVRIGDSTGKEVVMVNAPASWQSPENITLRDNHNLLSESVGYWGNVSGGFENEASGRFGTVAGGANNKAIGVSSSIVGGADNDAIGDYSTARGEDARATRYGEDVLASGMFAEPGDAQISQLVARQITDGEKPLTLASNGEKQIAIRANTSASYRIVVVARGKDGQAQAAFEATGIASRGAGNEVTLLGKRISPIYKSDPRLGIDVLPDSDLGMLLIQVQGLPAQTIRWIGHIELSEVEF